MGKRVQRQGGPALPGVPGAQYPVLEICGFRIPIPVVLDYALLIPVAGSLSLRRGALLERLLCGSLDYFTAFAKKALAAGSLGRAARGSRVPRAGGTLALLP